MRKMTFDNIPSHQEFLDATLECLHQDIANSDAMRSHIAAENNLRLEPVPGRWNDSPSNKFINCHAHALRALVTEGKILSLGKRQYRLARSSRRRAAKAQAVAAAPSTAGNAARKAWATRRANDWVHPAKRDPA